MKISYKDMRIMGQWKLKTQETEMKVIVYIPTLNAGEKWPEVVEMLRRQTYPISQKVLIDSGSEDGTLAEEYTRDFDIIKIDKKDFDHGGTRHLAVEQYPEAEIYVFITQDAILAHEKAIEHLVNAFEQDAKLGMAYGRQLPHKGAKELESHLRLFNYPPVSQVRSLKDAVRYGIKTISCSNSFAAYRKTAYMEVGGFPSGTILGVDVIIAGKMLHECYTRSYLS